MDDIDTTTNNEGSVMATPAVDLSQDVMDQLTLIEERILHALDIYHFLSSSMVHMSIGTATATGLWKPILTRLVEEGRVVRVEVSAKTPQGRIQSYTIYHRPEHPYNQPPTTNIHSDESSQDQAA